MVLSVKFRPWLGPPLGLGTVWLWAPGDHSRWVAMVVLPRAVLYYDSLPPAVRSLWTAARACMHK